MTDDRKLLTDLLRLIDRTAEREIDCEEFLHRSAGLVEALARSRRLAADWEELVQHLHVCVECEEEFEAVRRALADER